MKSPAIEARERVRRNAATARPFRVLAPLAVALLAAGCSGLAPNGGAPLATLDAVLRGERLATEAELQQVQVIRDGATVATRLRMSLQRDDEIVTGAEIRAVIGFAAGYEVIVAPEARMVIVNPRILLRRGWAYVRSTVGTVREAFRVDTEYLIAGTEGTEFLMQVDPLEHVTLTVAAGAVRVESKTQRFEPVVYPQYYQATYQGDSPPLRVRRLAPQELEPLVAWVREMDRILTRRVPSVVGQAEEQARLALQRDGLTVGPVRRQITGQAAAGTVIEQNPAAGTVGRAGDEVSLVVEGESVMVPNLAGQPVDGARNRLTRLGLRPQLQEEVVVGRSAGTVLEQRPAAGTRVQPGSTVQLRVAVAGVEVPNLMGQPLTAAQSSLAAAGLQLGDTSSVAAGDARPGTVLGQAPSPGTVVRRGARVSVRVAGTPSCTVPNVVRSPEPLRLQAATLILERAGLRARATTVGGDFQVVVGQSPRAGENVPCGSTVTLHTRAIIG
jgi:beta-lactam-binding protein with PASTA domain